MRNVLADAVRGVAEWDAKIWILRLRLPTIWDDGQSDTQSILYEITENYRMNMLMG